MWDIFPLNWIDVYLAGNNQNEILFFFFFKQSDQYLLSQLVVAARRRAPQSQVHPAECFLSDGVALQEINVSSLLETSLPAVMSISQGGRGGKLKGLASLLHSCDTRLCLPPSVRQAEATFLHHPAWIVFHGMIRLFFFFFNEDCFQFYSPIFLSIELRFMMT